MAQRFSPVSLQVAYKAFILSNQSRNLSQLTQKFYEVELQPFLDWCKEQGINKTDDLTNVSIRSYLASKSHLSGHTQHKHARVLRTFSRFLESEGYVSVSPFNGVKMPKLPKLKPEIFTHDQLSEIQKACNTERDKAICLFLVDSGVRASELCTLNYGDVSIKDGTVNVKRGKGNKDRTTFIGQRTRRQLSRYLAERGKLQGKDPLFATDEGKRLTVYGLSSLMGRLKERTGIEHLNPHKFRKTFAVESLKNGMNIYVLARIMGHEDITVLKHYLTFLDEDLKTAHSKSGVVDNL